ncbi:MAG: hypothetical protein RO257_03430 [Candidatus Kapabacteria bacterium]|jgi:hypothetical protein|nr:hypothetical protein [Candidatus Kapabacteria bacterium]
MKYLIIYLILLNQPIKLSHNNKEVELKIIDMEYPKSELDTFTYFVGVVDNDTLIILSRNSKKMNFDLFERIQIGSTYKTKLKLVVNIYDYLDGKTTYENLDKPGWIWVSFKPKYPDKELYSMKFDSTTGKSYYTVNHGIMFFPGFDLLDDEINYKLQLEKRYGDTVSFHLYYTSQETLGRYILKSCKVNNE